jgi:hypothetical protein
MKFVTRFVMAVDENLGHVGEKVRGDDQILTLFDAVRKLSSYQGLPFVSR